MPDSAPILQAAYERVRQQYGDAVSQRREELITPALVLDIDAAQRNIDRMASELRRMGSTTIRPHYPAARCRRARADCRWPRCGRRPFLRAPEWTTCSWSTPCHIRPRSGCWPSWPEITGSSSRWTRRRTRRRIPPRPYRPGQRSGSSLRWTPAWTAAESIPHRMPWPLPGR